MTWAISNRNISHFVMRLHFKNAASAVLVREKSTFLAELFSVELKFTVNTLNDWFSNTIKLNFFELNDIRNKFSLAKIQSLAQKQFLQYVGFC